MCRGLWLACVEMLTPSWKLDLPRAAGPVRACNKQVDFWLTADVQVCHMVYTGNSIGSCDLAWVEGK